MMAGPDRPAQLRRGRLRAAGAHLVYHGPGAQAWDIIAKTNGLRLIPPAADKRRQRPAAFNDLREAAMDQPAECNYCTLQAFKKVAANAGGQVVIKPRPLIRPAFPRSNKAKSTC